MNFTSACQDKIFPTAENLYDKNRPSFAPLRVKRYSVCFPVINDDTSTIEDLSLK